MAEVYYPEGFYTTTLSADITASATSIGLTTVPSDVSKGYLIIEPASTTKREVVHFTSVGASTVTAADDTTDGSDATGRGCKGSITAGANTAHDQGVTVIIAASYQYWKRFYDAFNAEHSTSDGTHDEAALDSMISGTESTGDIIYHNGTVWSRLAKGTDGQIVKQASNIPSWANQTLRVLLTSTSAFQLESSKPELTSNDGTNKEDKTLDYDASTDETDSWEIKIPSTITTIVSATLYLAYRMASATTAEVVWFSTHGAIASGETYDAAGTTDTFTADTVPDTAGKLKVVSKALTTSGWAAGDSLHIKIGRDADNGDDDATGDAKLSHALLEIVYQ